MRTNRLVLSFAVVIMLSLLQSCRTQVVEDLVNISTIKMFPKGYNHSMYAGFLNITNYAKSLYYVFFQSQNSPDDPVVLWLNGGPGCSSLIGMVTENGPFLFKTGSTEMFQNPYSWNKKANLLYLQAPAGVGFGWASKANMKTNDTQTAIDNLAGLRMFFQKFPDYEGNDFYIAGQSYAGIYIPMLAKQILQYNSAAENTKINLRGLLLGNPCTHSFECLTPTYYSRFFTEILYTHGFLQQQLYQKYQNDCILNQASDSCLKIQKNIKDMFLNTGANIYNLYGQCFYPKYPSEFEKLVGQEKMNTFEQKLGGRFRHPLRCSDAIGPLTLFNANQNRGPLHVDQLNDTLPWTPCSDDLEYKIDVGEVYRILPLLVRQGLKIIYYSGDQDAIVPLQGTLWWFQQYRNQFGAAIKKSWRPWISDSDRQDISGMVWQLEGLTLATVSGAGHMVPTDKPAEAFQILNNFLGYSNWTLPDYFEQ